MTTPLSEMPQTADGNTDVPPVQILISVPKRRLHHAVDRNCVKRQVREAYRRAKEPLWQLMEGSGQVLSIAFVFIGDEPCSSHRTGNAVRKLLRRIGEALQLQKKSV